MTAIELINRTMLRAGRDIAHRMVRALGLLFMVLAIISVAVTYAVLTGLTQIEPTPEIIQLSLIVNSVLVAGLIGSIGWEVKNLIVARKKQRAASRLHVRIVTLFSIVAAMPAVLVAVVASITLDQGLDRWFETRVRLIVENALTVAQAYVREHSLVLRGDLLPMAGDIDRAQTVYTYEPSRFDEFFVTQAKLRNFTGAFVLNRNGEVVVRTNHKSDIKYPVPPERAYEEAEKGVPTIIKPGVSNMVGGLVKLKAYDDLYLYVVRSMDQRVIDYQNIAQDSAQEFSNLDRSRFGVQVAFALIYIGVSLVLILSSIWLGFGFANRLVSPIRRLIGAANKVSGGDLQVQVPITKQFGDLATLGTTFNKMTSELNLQRDALLKASDQIDQRRRFTEAVLAGVTAGVIGIDKSGKITLLNKSAMSLLNSPADPVIEKYIGDVIPEISSFVKEALKKRDLEDTWQTQITLVRERKERIIDVRLTTEGTDVLEKGYVVTLDDITDLVTAQRHTAWADVARRIAHEIKNPLTPIQLSAERIRRRYGDKIDEEKSSFDKCVDTIVRQVGDIRRMVDEFSAFARMPKASFAENDLSEIVRECTFVQSIANPAIKYDMDLPDEPAMAWFDHRLVGQAVTNVVKNASESVTAAKTKGELTGLIQVRLYRKGESFVIEVIDNGIGLPATERGRLLEPYMTTRLKGTGLGLPIVRKIMEEHDGGIELLDPPEHVEGGQGAMIRLLFNIGPQVQKKSNKSDDIKLEPSDG